MAFPALIAPTLVTSTSNVVNVSTQAEYANALNNASAGDTIVLAAGSYDISNMNVGVSVDNLTVRGENDNMDDVVLFGNGQDVQNDNTFYGFYVTGDNFTVAYLTIRDTWLSAIQLQAGPSNFHAYNVRLQNSGEQFIKGSSVNNTYGQGANYGKVEYCVLEYLNGPPNHAGQEGYTNGVDVHGGIDWEVRNNVIIDLHVLSDSIPEYYQTNPAILFWNGANGTLVENNLIINCDRAIALGLVDWHDDIDHIGGIARNNICVLDENLLSTYQQSIADAQIITYHCTDAKVHHNTVITNGQTPYSIQARFGVTTGSFQNNLTDAAIHINRDSAQTTAANNTIDATLSDFTDPNNYEFTLVSQGTLIDRLDDVLYDFTDNRTTTTAVQRNALTDAGADQYAAYTDEETPVSIEDQAVVVDLDANSGDTEWFGPLSVNGYEVFGPMTVNVPLIETLTPNVLEGELEVFGPNLSDANEWFGPNTIVVTGGYYVSVKDSQLVVVKKADNMITVLSGWV